MLSNIVKYSHYEDCDNNDCEQNDVSCDRGSLGEAGKLERGGHERENIAGVLCGQELKE